MLLWLQIKSAKYLIPNDWMKIKIWRCNKNDNNNRLVKDCLSFSSPFKFIQTRWRMKSSILILYYFKYFCIHFKYMYTYIYIMYNIYNDWYDTISATDVNILNNVAVMKSLPQPLFWLLSTHTTHILIDMDKYKLCICMCNKLYSMLLLFHI